MAGDSNQAELPTELLGQTGPPARLCRWAELLTGSLLGCFVKQEHGPTSEGSYKP